MDRGHPRQVDMRFASVLGVGLLATAWPLANGQTLSFAEKYGPARPRAMSKDPLSGGFFLSGSSSAVSLPFPPAQTLTKNGVSSFAFHVKFDASGVPVWAIQSSTTVAAPPDLPQITASSADAQGNSYVVGSMEGVDKTLQFGDVAVTAPGSTFYKVFVAKFNAAGACQWIQVYGSSAETFLNGVAVDSTGNVVVGGQFQGTLSLPGGSLTSNGQRDGLIIKQGPSGSFLVSQ